MCSLVQLRTVKVESFGGCDCIFMWFFGADSSCLLLIVEAIDFYLFLQCDSVILET